jgi:hypothetical protein
MAANKKTNLLDILAGELGYKSGKDLKEKLKSGGGGLKSRLESGEGIKEAIKGSVSDFKGNIKKATDPKRFGKKVYMNFFGGDDVFSAYMRGRLNKQTKDKVGKDDISPTPDAAGSGGGIDQDAVAYLRIIAKSSLSLHLMSRDVNVLRQNIVKLTKIEADSYNKDKKKKDQVEAVGKADAFFLKEDEKEAKLEASKKKIQGDKPTQVNKEGKEKDSGGGLLDTIIGFFSNSFLGAFKGLLNPSALLKILGKVFIFATIFLSLFNGITAAFDRWKETGDLKESIIAGLGAIVDFLTFGFFGEDSVRSLFGSVSAFLDPIIDTIGGVIDGLKNWVVNNVGIPKISLGSIKNPFTGTVYDLGSVGPYYPFKKDPSSSAPEKTEKTPVKETKEVKGATEEEAAKARAKAAATDPRRVDQPAAETATVSPTPTPKLSDASQVERMNGEKIKLPSGVTYNAQSGDFIYNGVPFKAESQDEMDNFVKAINNKTVVEMQSKDSSGASVTKVLDGTTGDVSVKPPKQEAPSPIKADANVTVSGAPGMDGASGSQGAPGNSGASGASGANGASAETSPSAMSPSASEPSIPSGGGDSPPSGGSSQTAPAASETSPTEENAPAPMTASPSGSDLNSASMAVAEEQRMEASADEGTTINNSTNNSNTSSPDKPNTQIADVYDSEFAALLVGT